MSLIYFTHRPLHKELYKVRTWQIFVNCLKKPHLISNCPHFQADMLLITKIRGAFGGKERGRVEIIRQIA